MFCYSAHAQRRVYSMSVSHSQMMKISKVPVIITDGGIWEDYVISSVDADQTASSPEAYFHRQDIVEVYIVIRGLFVLYGTGEFPLDGPA